VRVTLTVAILLAGCAAPAGAQPSWTYRARITAETMSSLRNGAAPSTAGQAGRWTTGPHVVAAADAAWTSGDRLRIGTALAGVASSGGDVDGRVRELYARASAASWLDVEAGKRIIRWGVGYGYSPAGVLDPPRVATDPGDRLQLNDGRLVARAEAYRGATALTVAVAERRTAARLGTVLPGGVEVAAIAAAIPGERTRVGGTVTHVIGRQFAWHIDAMSLDDGRGRVLSAAVGFQYTFAAGLNVVLEYHRNGRGLNNEEWNQVLAGLRAAGPRPSRENVLFARIARAGDATVAPELIVLANMDDNGWTIVPSLTWTLHRHVQTHLRLTRLQGSRRSITGLAPFTTMVTAGATVRF
jgi:hypothetical protein